MQTPGRLAVHFFRNRIELPYSDNSAHQSQGQGILFRYLDLLTGRNLHPAPLAYAESRLVQ